MNERIKELVEEAYEYSDVPNTDGVFNKEKFAELIVRECIKQARKDENGLAYEAVGRIAEHFGIE